MEERVLGKTMGRERLPGPGTLRQAVDNLVDAGLDLGRVSVYTAERQLDAAIRVSEEMRDELLDESSKRPPGRERGLVSRLRLDAHRIVDVIADVGVYLLETGTPARPPQRAGGLAANVRAVEGIGDRYAARLAEAGVRRCEHLLEAGADPAGRARLAEETGISPGRLLTWVNHVDLFRIQGVGEEYASLLERAGVDSVPELAQRNPEALHDRLRATNEQTGEVRRLPSLEQVAAWIRQAATLPRAVTH